MKRGFFFIVFFLSLMLVRIDSYASPLFETNDYEISDTGHIVDGVVVAEESPSYFAYSKYYNFVGMEYLYILKYSDSVYELYGSSDIKCSAEYGYSDGSPITGSKEVNTIYFSNVVTISTNIPIFNANDTSSINAYINNGDYSGAVNKDTYSDTYDDTIPLPHNVKVLQGADQSVVGDASTTVGRFTRDVVLTWEQSDVVENMTYEIQFMSCAKRMSDDELTVREYEGFYETVVTDSYNGVTTVTVNIGVDTLNRLKESGFLTKQNFRIRNVINGKTSNWVLVTIDVEKGTCTATEQGYDEPGNTGGDEYNDTTVGGTTTGDVSIDGVVGYIKNGFGLLGNGGIIALMSGAFLYLPGGVWTILYFYISMLVVIGVIGAVKEFIF